MFSYEDESFSMCGEVECCALDSGIVPFVVTGKRTCDDCGGDCDGNCNESEYGMQGEFGDSRLCI